MALGKLTDLKYTTGGSINMNTTGGKKSVSFSLTYKTKDLVLGSTLRLSYRMSSGIDIHINKGTVSKLLNNISGSILIEVEFADNKPSSGETKAFTLTVTGNLDNQLSEFVSINY